MINIQRPFLSKQLQNTKRYNPLHMSTSVGDNKADTTGLTAEYIPQLWLTVHASHVGCTTRKSTRSTSLFFIIAVKIPITFPRPQGLQGQILVMCNCKTMRYAAGGRVTRHRRRLHTPLPPCGPLQHPKLQLQDLGNVGSLWKAGNPLHHTFLGHELHPAVGELRIATPPPTRACPTCLWPPHSAAALCTGSGKLDGSAADTPTSCMRGYRLGKAGKQRPLQPRPALQVVLCALAHNFSGVSRAKIWGGDLGPASAPP